MNQANPFLSPPPAWPPAQALSSTPSNPALDLATGEMLADDRDQLLADWQQTRKLLARVKEQEALLRTHVVRCYATPEVKSGTERIELGDGWQLKTVKKLTYTLDAALKVDAVLDALEKSSEDGKFVAERLVKWSPDLVLAEYKRLSKIHKALIDEVLTIKEGMPTVDLVAPAKDEK